MPSVINLTAILLLGNLLTLLSAIIIFNFFLLTHGTSQYDILVNCSCLADTTFFYICSCRFILT